MTDLINAGNGGANGTNVTLANSSNAGTAFSHIVAGGTTDAAAGDAACQYSNGIASTGLPMAVRLTLGGNPAYFRWDDTQTGTRFTHERDFYVPASVTGANYIVVDMRSSIGVMATIVIGTDKKLYLTNPTNTVVAASASPVLTSGQRVRVRMAVTKESATGAGDGIVELAVYSSDYTTLLHSYTKTGATTGTANPSQYRFGDSNVKTSFTYDYVGVPAAGPRASGWAPVNPTVTINTPVQNVAAGAAVSVTATATSPLGIASTAWTVDYSSGTAPTLTGASTTTAGFTAPAAGSLVVLKVVVTDNNGQTATAIAEVRVPSSSGSVTVLPDDGGKGYTVQNPWTVFGSAATAAAALRDSDDTTGVESPDVSATPTTSRYRLAPMTALTGLIVTLAKLRKTDTGSLTAVARLLQGATVLESFTVTNTTTATDRTITAASGTIAAITDPGNLWVEVQAAA